MHKEESFLPHTDVLSGPHLCVSMFDKRIPPNMIFFYETGGAAAPTGT